MRVRDYARLVCVSVVLLSGCGRPAPVAKPSAPADPNPTWPADSLERPEFLSTVERQAGYVPGDAEPARVPSTYQIPDWAEPTSTISARGPKGSRITFHLLRRDEALRKQEDERIAALIQGKKRAAETLFVARPWIGWYGQGTGKEAVSATQTQDYTLRIYLLFSDAHQLEVHIQWPTGNKEAFEEGQALLAHLVYSLRPKGQS